MKCIVEKVYTQKKKKKKSIKGNDKIQKSFMMFGLMR